MSVLTLVAWIGTGAVTHTHTHTDTHRERERLTNSRCEPMVGLFQMLTSTCTVQRRFFERFSVTDAWRTTVGYWQGRTQRLTGRAVHLWPHLLHGAFHSPVFIPLPSVCTHTHTHTPPRVNIGFA